MWGRHSCLPFSFQWQTRMSAPPLGNLWPYDRDSFDMPRTDRVIAANRQRLTKHYPNGLLPEEDRAALPGGTTALTAWGELSELEQDATRLLGGKAAAEDASPTAQSLGRWLDHYVTAEGLFLPASWETFRLLPRLDR